MEKYLQQTKSDCIKIVLYGPESTGKSTLAKQLAEYYKTDFVQEYAREYLQKKYFGLKFFQPQDLLFFLHPLKFLFLPHMLSEQNFHQKF